jgi:hypothetical protein
VPPLDAVLPQVLARRHSRLVGSARAAIISDKELQPAVEEDIDFLLSFQGVLCKFTYQLIFLGCSL